MTAPTIRDLVASGRITLAVETMEADGELTLVAHQGRVDGDPARRQNAIQARADAWAINPRCLVCNTVTPSPERSAYLRTPDGPRVTCKTPCFATAVARENPTFNRATALRRAGGQ